MLTRCKHIKEQKKKAILIDLDGRYYRWHRKGKHGTKPRLNGEKIFIDSGYLGF